MNDGGEITSYTTTSQRSESRDGSTREVIIGAALRILARDGFPGLTARAIAAEAGTNLALVNYHFGSKRNLVLAVADALEVGKFARQREMYDDPEAPLSRKWRQAVEYYRQDLDDGFVRIFHELCALGFADELVAQRARDRLNRWRQLLEDVAQQWQPVIGLPIPANITASMVVSFWMGMELQHLIGNSESDGQFFAILDAVGDWLEQREQLDAARTEAGPAAK